MPRKCECQSIGAQCQDNRADRPLPFKFEENPRVHTFKVGDPVERREWIGMTKGQIVEVKCDESTVGVEWQVGFRLAGTRTTEQACDLRRAE